jgi:hypothetical protein
MDPTLIVAVAGFAAIAAAGAWLGAGRFDVFIGLMPPQPRPTWPSGVQEGDAPHFHLERWSGSPAAAEALPELVEDPGQEQLVFVEVERLDHVVLHHV